MAVQILTPEIKKEIAYWNSQFDRAKSLREPFEKQWLLNLAFYFGKQYVIWTPQSSALANQTLTEPPAPKHRVRVVANKVKPAVRRELTKLIKNEPHFYVSPASNEPTDVASAKIGESLAEYYLDVLNYNRVRRSATFWMLICGTSFMKHYVTPAMNEMGQPTVKLELDSITPMHIFVPLIQEETVDKQPFIIHGRAIPVETVESSYNVKIKADIAVTTPPLEAKLHNALGIRSSNTEAPKDMCFAKEIWVQPCKKYPDGALLVIVNDQLVHVAQNVEQLEETPVLEAAEGETYSRNWSQSAFPFEHGQYPFAKIDHIPAGRFYNSSVIDDLIPLQVEYNKTRSQIIESKNRMALPQRYYEKGSLDPGKVTSEPGLMIPINPGFNYPKASEMPSLPNFVMQELDRTLSDMDDNTAQYEVAKGRTPPGVEAASAIAYLQEENDSILHSTVASIEEATVKLGRQILSNVQQFVPNEELLEIVTRNNSIEAEQFKGKNLKTAVDLRIEAGSMAPKSSAARQAFITELMKLGIIPAEKGLRYLQLNETNRLYEELQVDAKAAQRENYLMSTGRGFVQDMQTGEPMPMPTNVWDNHSVHEYEHGLFLKSQEFDLIQDQDIKNGLIAHYMQHKQELMANYNITGGTSEPADSGAVA